MPVSTHRAHEIIRSLQDMEHTIRLLCNEVEDSLVRNEHRFFFHIGQQVRITCPLVLDVHSQIYRNNPKGEVRLVNFDDGTITLWMYGINGVDV